MTPSSTSLDVRRPGRRPGSAGTLSEKSQYRNHPRRCGTRLLRIASSWPYSSDPVGAPRRLDTNTMPALICQTARVSDFQTPHQGLAGALPPARETSKRAARRKAAWIVAEVHRLSPAVARTPAGEVAWSAASFEALSGLLARDRADLAASIAVQLAGCGTDGRMTGELEALLASPLNQHEEFSAAIANELLLRQATAEASSLRRDQAAQRRSRDEMRAAAERETRDAALATASKRESEYRRRFPRRIAD
jgi:hypothetical protein